MSRSIHSTYREYLREQRFDYADDAVREERLANLRQRIARKRRIKSQVHQERSHPPRTDLPPVDPATIPIEIRDQGEEVHYPASMQDLRCVMERLPVGALTGVSTIRLCLGKLQQEGWLSAEEHAYLEEDPWRGRSGIELLPGVFTGALLGQYQMDEAWIELYAYLYRPDLPNREMWEFFLRLHALSTFVHEIAHHEDQMRRIARGRWRMDDEQKDEAFADATQAQWVRAHVVPYLKEIYPEAARELRLWVRHHGGATVPLDQLAGDWRWVTDTNVVPVCFGTALKAFCDLVEDVHQDVDPAETKLNFARKLHYGEYYDVALDVLANILEEQPGHRGALTLKADIFEHQARYGEAESLARFVLDQDATCLGAWEVLAKVYFATADWPALIDAATGGMGCTEGRDFYWRGLLELRARAHLELGQIRDAEADLDRLAGSGPGANWAAPLQSVLALRAGELETVLEIAASQTHQGKTRYHPALIAARFEAAHKLGRPEESGALSTRDLDRLRRLHYGEWADRLAETYGNAIRRK